MVLGMNIRKNAKLEGKCMTLEAFEGVGKKKYQDVFYCHFGLFSVKSSDSP